MRLKFLNWGGCTGSGRGVSPSFWAPFMCCYTLCWVIILSRKDGTATAISFTATKASEECSVVQ